MPIAFPGLSCPPSPPTQSQSSPANITFSLANDLGREWISSYSATDIETLNLDQPASGGMRFQHNYAMHNAPLDGPISVSTWLIKIRSTASIHHNNKMYLVSTPSQSWKIQH